MSSLRSRCFRRIWEQRKVRNGIFWCFACAENKAKAKNEISGWGRGRKGTLVDKPLDFENLRSPANGARDWLG